MVKKLSPVFLLFGAVLFFFIDCYCVSNTLKRISALLLAAAFAAIFLAYGRLRDQMRLPVLALGLLVLLDGISCAYTTAGYFAVYEFLRVLAAFCIALVLLAACNGRRISIVLTGGAAVSSVVSIDMLATRLISGPLLETLGRASSDYQNLPGVEPGIRMTSMFLNPNVFAGFVGIAVLLGLGLVTSSAGKGERAVHLVLLFVNSLAFLLAFSMGALMAIAVSFPVYLLLEQKGQRMRSLLLMAETLLVTLLMAYPISVTSFSAWEGIRPAPLLCLVLGAALLCGLDLLAGDRLAGALKGRGRALAGIAGGCCAASVVFLVAALHWTGAFSFSQGEALRRSRYPDPGEYRLSCEADGPLQVVIRSQNWQDTMTHEGTLLYTGEADGAAFTVPEDSAVVHFDFTAEGEVCLTQASYTGERGAEKLPLRYRLLPAFIVNRLQGLWANQNAVQRFAFFADGLRLFRRSPIIGLGMGAYENGLQSVQTFYYGTRYAHNHYIQSLVDTGIIGLIVFLGLLAALAAAVWCGRKRGVPLAPALGGALAFLAAHVMVEMVFSTYTYLPMAFGMFAVINDSCAEGLPTPGPLRSSRGRGGILLGGTALLFVCGLILGGNVAAYNIAAGGTLEDYAEAARLDLISWENHATEYMELTLDTEVDAETRAQADRYAERIERKGSAAGQYVLTKYYLGTGRMEEALAAAQCYARWRASSPSAWQRLFSLLDAYEEDTPLYREGIRALAAQREEWMENNIGTIALTAENEAFLARVLGAAA